VEGIASAGAFAAITVDTNCVTYLRLAQNAIELLAGGTNFSTTALTNAIASVSDNTEASQIVNRSLAFVVGTFDTYYRKVVAVKIDDQVPWLRPVAWAIADGIDDGLTACGY
jgi:hypothetical protein